MKIQIAAALSLFPLCATSLGQSTAHDYHYVQGGFINGIHMSSTLKGICVHEGGRIEYTSDGGQTWNEADVPDGYRGELRGAFTLGTEAWAVGDGGVVLHSSNDGQNWMEVTISPIMTVHSSASPAELYDILMLDSDKGYAVGNDGGLWWTDNNWLTHSHATTLPLSSYFDTTDAGDAYDIDLVPDRPGDSDSNPGAIIASDNSVMLYTDDVTLMGSTVWNSATVNFTAFPPGAHYLEFWSTDIDDYGRGFAVGGAGFNSGTLFYTEDYGLTWDQDEEVAYNIYSGASGDNDFPATCGLPTFYGVSVTTNSSGTPGQPGYVPPVAVAVAYAASVYEFNPNLGAAPFTVFDQSSCSGTGVITTEVWEQVDPQVKSPIDGRVPYTTVFALSANDIWHTGHFGNKRKFNSSTQLWEEKGTVGGIRLNAGDFWNSTDGVVIGQANTIKRTTDAGQSWTTVYQGTNNNEFGRGIEVTPSGYGMAIGSNGFGRYTTDFGVTWTALTPPVGFGIPSNLRGVTVEDSSGIAYFYGANGFVGKVDLTSLTWTNVSIGVSDLIHGCSFSSPTTGYAVGEDMSAYFTSNGGTTWTTVGVLPSIPGEDFKAVKTWGSGANAYAVGTSGIVYFKASTRFVPVATGFSLTEDLHSIEVINSGADVIIGGDHGQVLHFENGSWKNPKSQTREPIYSISFSADDQGFLIGKKFIIVEYRP